MRKLASALIVLVATLMAGHIAARVFAYEIEIKNDLDASVSIELRQYHAVGFDGTRPVEWSDDLLVHSKRLDLAPGARGMLPLNDAAGGYWVVWKATDGGTGVPTWDGVVELQPRHRPGPIVLSRSPCGRAAVAPMVP